MKLVNLTATLSCLFIVGILVVIDSLTTKSIPLQIYVLFSSVVGMALVGSIFLSSRKGNEWAPYLLIIFLTLVLWNFHALATHYNLIAFYDSYQDLVHLKLILNNGRIYVGAYDTVITTSGGKIIENAANELGIGPGFSPSYPLFSSLAALFSLVTGMDPLKVGILLPFANGILLLLSTFLIVRKLLLNVVNGELAVLLAALAFAVSPDMVYAAAIFYHRELSLALGFVIIYLSIKYLVGELDLKGKIVLVLMVLVLPLSHSAYPNVYTVTLVSLLLISTVLRMLSKVCEKVKVGSWIRLMTFPAVMLFMTGFLWNLVIFYPTPVSVALRGYISNLLNPKYQIGDIERFLAQAAPVLPKEVRPEPWTILLPMRDLLLYAPIAIVGIFLVSKLLTNNIRGKTELPALLVMLSFTPMILLDYISGWYPLGFRDYAFPLVAYSFGLLYGSLIKLKIKIVKALSFLLLCFLITMAFMSPFWHIYYPSQLYDPNVGWNEVGFPNPLYVNFIEFAKAHEFEGGFILSDFTGLLAVTLPVSELTSIRPLMNHYGNHDTYIVEFVALKPLLGYSSLETVEKMAQIRANITYEYCKVLDGGAIYNVYYKQ